MTESLEQAADLKRRKLTRCERKVLRKEDLRQCTPESRAELWRKAQRSIQDCKDSFFRANANGMNISPKTLEKNIASDVLTLECLAEIEAEGE